MHVGTDCVIERIVNTEKAFKIFKEINIVGYTIHERQINIIIDRNEFNPVKLSGNFYRSCTVSRTASKKKFDVFNSVVQKLLPHDSVERKVETMLDRHRIWNSDEANQLKQLKNETEDKLMKSKEFTEFYSKIRNQVRQLEKGPLSKGSRKEIARDAAKAEVRKLVLKFQTKYHISFSESIELVEELVPQLKVEEVMEG